jgi:hypothetical protein
MVMEKVSASENVDEHRVNHVHIIGTNIASLTADHLPSEQRGQVSIQIELEVGGDGRLAG